MLTMEQKTQLMQDLEDDGFRKRFYGRFLQLHDWRVMWDKLNHGAFQVLSKECRNEMTLEQLGYCANRHAAAVSQCYRPQIIRPRKINPKTIHVWVIYWIYRDGTPDVPLYVGMTRQLSERWTAHRGGSSETKDIEDLTTIRITVVETVCGGEREARIAERRRIAEALRINSELLNKAGT